jgi:predicted amidohydrolase
MKQQRIALAQTNPRLGDVKKNLLQVLAWVEKARLAKAGLVVFPELSMTGYFLKDLVPDVAVRTGSSELNKLALASREIDILASGVYEDSQHRYYNASFFFSRGKLRAIHRKVYPPTYGMFDEGRYFGQGEGPTLFESAAGSAACLICEDAWHAVLPLASALQGAGLLLIPSSSPARNLAKKRGGSEDEGGLAIVKTWQRLNRVWAQTQGVWVAYCNRVGVEDGVGFWGGSEVVGPDGTVVASAPVMKEHLLLAEIPQGPLRRARLASPHLRDEKLDMDARLFANLAGWKLNSK